MADDPNKPAGDDPHIGRVIRQWRLIRKIGGGGMGTVFEVQHARTHYLRRALKQIKIGLEQNSEVVRRFRREVNLMAQLEGADHIVRVHDFDEAEGFGTFVLMDLIDGPSLADMIRQQRGRGLPYKDVLHYGGQIASALQLVHDREVVHRDIKAANVLVDLKKRKAYLTDFGIAKELAAAAADSGDQTMSDETSATVASQYIGTARYSSPEQLRVEYPPKPIWDIYSMGAVLYEAYSGLTYLPQFRSYPEFLRHIGMDEKFKLELAYPTPPPPSFAALVELCLQRDPEERMQSAGELAERLAECERELRSHAAAVPGTTAPELPKPAGAPDELRRQMREEIEQRFQALDEIEGTLVGAGLNLEAPPTAETLHQALRDISQMEGAGQMQEALGHLEQLREQAQAAHRRAERAVHDGLEQRAAEVERDLGAVRQRGGPWTDAAQLAAAGQALAAARKALGESHWKQAGDELAHLSERLPGLAEAARQAAEPALRAAAEAIAGQAAALEALGGKLPRGFDIAGLRDRLQREFDAGDLAAAQQHAETAQMQIEAELRRAREEAGQRLRAARADSERAAAEIDLAAARVLAAERIAEAESAMQAARAAEASDAAAAATAFARAARAYRAAGARVAEQQAGERTAAIEALRTHLGASADEPEAVVGAARRAAETVLAKPPAAHAAALTALRDALAALTAARTELPAFAEAERRRQAAEVVQQRTAGLQQVDAEARRGAAKVMAEAGRLVAERRWADAAARYAVAAQAFETIEQDSLKRDAEARFKRVRAEVSETLAALEQLAGHAAALQVRVAAPDFGALGHELGEGVELERGGARDDAIEKLTALRARLAEAERAYGAALGPAVERTASAVAQGWGELAARAGGLATPARAQEAGRLVDAIGNAAKRQQWEPALEAIAKANAWLDRAATELRAEAGTQLETQLAELTAGVKRLRELGAQVPAGVDVEALRRDATAALDAGRLAAAGEPLAAARRTLDTALAAHRQALERRATAARQALEAQLGELDLDAARAVAKPRVEEATRLRADAAKAEERKDFAAAATAYARAAEAFAAAAAALEKTRREQIATLMTEVRGLDQQAAKAPVELVDTARKTAKQALDGAERAVATAALASLEQARDGLTRALGEVEAYTAAAAGRATAEQSQARLTELPLTREERDEAATVMRGAGADFDRHTWVDARKQYDSARARLDAIAEGVRKRVEEQKALAKKLDEARKALRAAADKVRGEEETVVGAAAEERRGELTVIGPALQAADALLKAEDAQLEAFEAAREALAAAIAQLPDYRAAAQQRRAAEAAKTRAAEKFPGKSMAKPAKLLAAAEHAFGERQWQAAAQRYADAATHYGSFKPAAVPIWAIAGGGGLVAAVAAAAFFLIPGQQEPVRPVPPVQPPAEQARVQPEVPREEPRIQPEAREEVPPAQPQVQPQPTVEIAALPPTAVVVEPTRPIVVAPSIASAEPAGETVAIDEGKTQAFAIQLADASDATAIEWSFDGKPVRDAAGKKTWTYESDADAAGEYTVAVKVGDGAAPDRLRSWRVKVSDLNEPVNLTEVLPGTSTEIKKDIGQTVGFSVKAVDKDGDKLRYTWSVDDVPAGADKPTFNLPVTKEEPQIVALAITDGKMAEPLRRQWKVTGKLPPCTLAGQPGSVGKVTFGGRQTFKLTPSAGCVAPLQIAWAVDGRAVTDSPTFTFAADNPALIRREPIEVVAKVTDAKGREVRKPWSFAVVPPAPPLRVSPPAGTIELLAGERRRFTIDEPNPVGDQRFEYTFTVNGKPVSREASFELTTEAGRTYEVVASIADNFDQRARDAKWLVRSKVQTELRPTVPPAPQPDTTDPEGLVKAWLDTYRGALNSKDVPQICAMLRLDGGKCATLGKALGSQEDLRVTFSGVTISETGSGACASYTRNDTFKDPTGKRQERSAPVKDCFTVVNGEVRKN